MDNTAGTAEIVTEMLTNLNDLWIYKITNMINKIYDRRAIPEDLIRFIYIMIQKVLGGNKRKFYRVIKLMSHITKLIINILLNRARGRIWRRIEEKHCGDVQETGARNVIFMIQILSNRAT